MSLICLQQRLRTSAVFQTRFAGVEVKSYVGLDHANFKVKGLRILYPSITGKPFSDILGPHCILTCFVVVFTAGIMHLKLFFSRTEQRILREV